MTTLNFFSERMAFDGQRAKLLQGLTGHTSDVTSCDFAPNYLLITGSRYVSGPTQNVIVTSH